MAGWMRRIPVIVAVAAVAALAPAAALGAALVGFTASGTVVQTDPGVSTVAVSSGLPGGFPDGILGRLTTGQVFQGRLTASRWGALKKARLQVAPHNSFVTFLDGVPDFAGGQEAIVGVAFGRLEVTKGRGNYLRGGYVAGIQGVLTLDFACPVDPALGLPARVWVADAGQWVATEQHGAYATIVPQGELYVEASGCLGQETASVVVSGLRADGHADEDQDDDDEDSGGRHGHGNRGRSGH